MTWRHQLVGAGALLALIGFGRLRVALDANFAIADCVHDVRALLQE